MHDPMSVAHEVRYPWRKYRKGLNGEPMDYREPFITIWHVDPERDGTDDSCDWFNHKRKPLPLERAVREAAWDLETLLDNEPHYPNSPEHKAFQPLMKAITALIHQPSRTHWWQLHPRWHFWHWEIQVRPWQTLRRWLFTRCCRCGKRFAWGASPCSSHWDTPKHGWFRSEIGLYHADCDRPEDLMAAQTASAAISKARGEHAVNGEGTARE